jgi:hypothetical protein
MIIESRLAGNNNDKIRTKFFFAGLKLMAVSSRDVIATQMYVFRVTVIFKN